MIFSRFEAFQSPTALHHFATKIIERCLVVTRYDKVNTDEKEKICNKMFEKTIEIMRENKNTIYSVNADVGHLGDIVCCYM